MPISDWGARPSGYYLPRFPEVRTELDAIYKSRLGADRNTAHGTVDGSIVDFVADVVSRLFEADQETYNAHFFDTAEGAALDNWLSGRGFSRIKAFSTRVTLTPTGTASTVVLAGSVIRAGDDGELFSSEADGIIGTDDIVFIAQSTGPISAAMGIDWQIVTTVSGWDGVDHDTETEVPGADIETDVALKSRYTSALLDSAAADIQKVDGVTSVVVYENDTETPDGLYGDIKWAEFLVLGGEDQDVANAVWQAKCPGIQLQGTTALTETVTGDANTVRFGRGNEVDITLAIAISASSGFPTGTAAQDQLAESLAVWGNANHAHGDDVSRDMVVAEIGRLNPGSRFTVTSFLATGDTSSALILTIPDRDIARFDAADITVTIT